MPTSLPGAPAGSVLLHSAWCRPRTRSVAVVSTYLPYCDALFIDTKCADLLAAANQELSFGYSAEVFTELAGRPAGMATSVEEAESVEHRELVERVYGSSWLHPYRSIFKTDKATDDS